MIKKVLIACFALGIFTSAHTQTAKSRWVDSVFATLDLSKKIGQLFMVPVNGLIEADQQRAEALLKSHQIGGIVFTKGTPMRQVQFTNHLQNQSAIPMLVAMDAEGGLAPALDSTIQFASPLLLGGIKDDSLIYFLGAEIGRELHTLGVHITFGITANLNTAFKKELLQLNTYGSNRERVSHKTLSFQRGLKDSNVLSVIKNYVDVDFSEVPFSKKYSPDANKMYILKNLMSTGSTGVLNVFNHELLFHKPIKKIRVEEKKITEDLLSTFSSSHFKNQFNFNGLVFSYIPDIKTLKKFKTGEAEVFAFKSGNNVLISDNAASAIRKLKKAIRKDAALENHLNESIKKILSAKYDAGLSKHTSSPTENLLERLNIGAASLLQETLLEKAITVVKNNNSLIPVAQLENTSFASLLIGLENNNVFRNYLNKYTSFSHHHLHLPADTINLVNRLQKYDVVIAAVYPYASTLENIYPSILEKLSKQTKLIVVEFGTLNKISLLQNLPVLIEGYSDKEVVQKIIPQIIFGATKADATLPLSLNEFIKEGDGIETVNLERLGYALPEAVGIHHDVIEKVTKIAREAIDQKATPGCQVIVARRGKIIYEKSLGWQTYDNTTPINDQSIYDLASVTKVAATLQATMFLYERGEIDIYKKASVYLPELVNSNKKDLVLKDILTHQAGLTPFVPFWIQTVKDSNFLPQYYSRERNESHPLQIAPGLFGVKSLRDSLWHWSILSKLREKPPRTPYNFVYSDIGLYILHHLNDRLLNQPQEEFLQQNLYDPLGASTMGYLPLDRFDANQIVPTENDQVFRKTLLRGTAHDEGAAMLGGVAGHAGLFSSAIDLTKLAQMLLQKGYYGGQHYFKPETVNYFTTKQFETSRRGLGWDKPVQSEWNSPTSILASPLTFGHTGFTGTCVWIDPQFDLVYVFLSNRVYPDRSTNKLSALNIRSRIQDVIYQSIFNYGQFGNNQSAIERYIQSSISSNPNKP